MRKTTFAVFGLVAALLVVPIWAQDATKVVDGNEYRIIQTNGKEVRGVVTVLPDAYKIRYASGITITIPKNRVAKVLEVEAAKNKATANAALGTTTRRRISQAEIEEILGSDNLDIGSPDRIEQVDLRAPFPTDMSSVREMLQIAGKKARYLDSFPHFVLVYTSDRQKAHALGARLEAVYEWNIRYMEMLDLPRTRAPDAKLEIFFFGTWDEYRSYQALSLGQMMEGAIGFYMPTNNRSAFFDMMTYPPFKRDLERAKDPSVPWRERQKIKSRLKHEVAHKNLEVVQHEASHHIHFNVGIFPSRGDVPRWMAEGLATMFEFPPTEVGASLGAINHFRLYWFRRVFGEHGEKLPDMRQFILNDGVFMQLGFNGYSIGWALNQYLFHKHREQYAKWMRLLGKRDSDFGIRIDLATKQKQFEDIFGEINDEWVKEFNDYIASIPLRRAVLPPSARDGEP